MGGVMDSKPCSTCGETKPLEAYSPNPRGRLGRQARCRACYREWRRRNQEKVRQYQATYEKANRDKRIAYRDANRERDNERSRAYYAANREKVRSRQAEWTRENQDKKKALDAAYRAANREKIRAYRKAYGVENRERIAGYDARRRARIADTSTGPVDLEALWTGRCDVCGSEMSRDVKWPDPDFASIDHVIPLSRGGTHTQGNLQWAHLSCNQRKAARVESGVAR